MKPTTISNEKTNESIRVSINLSTKTGTIIKLDEEGVAYAKYKVLMSANEIEYYDDGVATYNDWMELLRSGWSYRV